MVAEWHEIEFDEISFSLLSAFIFSGLNDVNQTVNSSGCFIEFAYKLLWQHVIRRHRHQIVFAELNEKINETNKRQNCLVACSPSVETAVNQNSHIQMDLCQRWRCQNDIKNRTNAKAPAISENVCYEKKKIWPKTLSTIPTRIDAIGSLSILIRLQMINSIFFSLFYSLAQHEISTEIASIEYTLVVSQSNIYTRVDKTFTACGTRQKMPSRISIFCYVCENWQKLSIQCFAKWKCTNTVTPTEHYIREQTHIHSRANYCVSMSTLFSFIPISISY